MQFFALIKLLLSILPLVIDCVKAVEAAFPSIKGSSKLGMVMNTINTAATHASDMEHSVEAIAGPVQSLVNGVVSTFNAAGIFAHAAASPVSAIGPTVVSAPISSPGAASPEQALAQFNERARADAIGG